MRPPCALGSRWQEGRTGWVPEPLRTPGQSLTPGSEPDLGADTDGGSKDPNEQAAHGPPQAIAAE
jgi:hypothetical protein